MKTFNIASLAIATALALPAVGQAQDVSVKVKRYELTTPAGQQAVVDRISRVVRNACRDTLYEHRCARRLGGEMIGQLNSPAITALWNGKGTAVASR